jgi:predicted RNA-binding Zn ribbon-like protein
MPVAPGKVVVMSDLATERYTAAPAPALLRRVQSFLNTRSTGIPPEADLLANPASANSWLRTLEWPTRPRLTTDDLPPLYQLREALQAQLEADRTSSESPLRLDLARHLEKLRWGMTLNEGRLVLSAEGDDWRLVAGTLLGDILLAQQHELWPRLKACRNPPCSVVFYDNSKNQSRVWHNTSVCGNLVNLRAARARQRARAT